jgi:hypothetical protein
MVRQSLLRPALARQRPHMAGKGGGFLRKSVTTVYLFEDVF